MNLITILVLAAFGMVQEAKQDDKKPATPFLKSKITELDKLFRASIKANTSAKTTADKQDAAERHQEILIEWCESLEGEQVDFEVVIEDIIKKEVAYFAKTTTSTYLLPFKSNPNRLPYMPLVANQSLFFELSDDQKEMLTIGTKLKVTGNLLVASYKDPRGVYNWREFATDRVELLKVNINGIVISGNGVVKIPETPHSFYLDEVKLEVIGVPKPVKPTKPTKSK